MAPSAARLLPSLQFSNPWMIRYGGRRILSLYSPLWTQALPPLEVFVLRIVLGEPREDQVHGVVEIVRNDRRCTFHNFEELLQLLQRELESARSGRPVRPGRLSRRHKGVVS
jgi:hypothetical protein